ncbi:phosphotransferase family protein [Brevibacillus choshinensis]|uniref:phosphotransferase family protein n=1 Tax=Brevibacillus choshinensis TaxID=54911 RepID=UPI001EED8A9B|nr:aminoglycoside phosphotransferase family protein [Brevibacillus choshinensis]
MEDWLQALIHTSPSLRNTERIEQIFKGFSTDLKYRVYLSDGTQRMLRIADRTAWEQKKKEFAILEVLKKMEVKASLPMEQAVLEESNHCYMVLSYLEGEDAKDALPVLSLEEQYEIGRVAGTQLAAMHTICAEASVPEWEERCLLKHERYVEAYYNCGYRIPQAEKILTFIEDHTRLLRDVPNRFLHDDFHVGNLIVHEGKYAGAIDFNRMDWGDPVHDFTKLAFFSRETSVPFCIGQIRGYLERTGAPAMFFGYDMVCIQRWPSSHRLCGP